MMTTAGNPYTPGEPVGEPGRFFGRDDLLASVREQLVRDRRVVILGGTSRIGKTSFLRRLCGELPDGFVPIMVGLAEDPVGGADRPESRIARAVCREVPSRLPVTLPEPASGECEDKGDRFLGELWPRVREALGDRTAVLLLDDVDRLQDEPGDLDALSTFLLRWRRQDRRLAFVITSGSARLHSLGEEYPSLFEGAPTMTLGSLPNEDALRLITQPVEGRVAYDHGVPRRLVELTSGHPHYLQLVCSALYDRCARDGWVNQHDVDEVVEDLAGREMAEFRQLWNDSTPQEQAVLAALAALRGARGVATANEVLGLLVRAGAQVTHAQVLNVLAHLAGREIVERLGALSYRLRVALLRDWLDKHVDLGQAMRAARWQTSGRRRVRQPKEPTPKRARARKAPADRELEPEKESGPSPAAGGQVRRGTAPRRSRLWLVLAGAACAGLILTGAWLKRDPGRLTPASTLPATASAVSLPTQSPNAPTTLPANPATLQAPTAEPTATGPVITNRSLPVIAYLSKPRDQGLWTAHVMGSDGRNRVPVTEASSDFVSAPSWSPSGDRLALVSDRAGNADIWIVDRDGRNAANLTANAAKESSPAWSPDGDWIAFASVRDSPYWELYVMRTDGSGVRRLTWWQDASDLWPSWSPDGSRLAFASKRDGNWEIYTMARDGSDLVRITGDPADDMHPAWSPDGRWIAFDSLRDGYSDVFVVPAEGGEATNLTKHAWASDLAPTWSPDGSRIAFCSNRSGDWDIFVMTVDGSGLVRLTTEDTQDQLPAWRP